MNERYGRSFVGELVDAGDFDEAVTAASELIDQDRGTAELHFERARAYEGLEDFARALPDYERAIALNDHAKLVDRFVLDDAYFSALLDAAERAADKPAAVALVDRYAQHAKEGGHHAEAREWRARMAGVAPSLLDKTQAH